MEGKSLPVVIAVVLSLAASVSVAQTEHRGTFNSASFLEPNHFAVSKDLNNRELWLIAGYGHLVLGEEQSGGLGMEGLIWSRLRSLSDFRFPVETADYFFGIYAIFKSHSLENQPDLRIRLSHISSHIVDGADSVLVGGSSSRFSREFLEVSKRFQCGDDLTAHVGVRWLFHQVQSIEPALAFPMTLSWRFFNSWSEPAYDRALGRDNRYEASLYATTAYGPSWPTYGAGALLTVSNDWLEPTDLKVYYVWGASWAGVEAAKRMGAVRAEVSLHAF